MVPKLFEHDFAYIFQNPDKRIIFAIPYERDFTLIGTTDGGKPISAWVCGPAATNPLAAKYLPSSCKGA